MTENLQPDRKWPDEAGERAMWNAMRVTPLPVDDVAVTDLLDALRKTHVNGGVIFAQFEIGDARVFQYFVSRFNPGKVEGAPPFLSSPAMVAALPELCGVALRITPLDFDVTNSFAVAGEIARTLAEGGAYKMHEQGSAHAYVLAEKFRAWLIGDRFKELQVFRSFAPWSEWFWGVAWDFTWIIWFQAVACVCAGGDRYGLKIDKLKSRVLIKIPEPFPPLFPPARVASKRRRIR